MTKKKQGLALGDSAQASDVCHAPQHGKSQHNNLRHCKQSGCINFAAINSAALAQIFLLLHRLLPGGVLKGTEYTVRNPARPDKSAGSFKINIRTGRWADFAVTDAQGGDIVSLVAYLLRTSQVAAARELAQMLGVRT